MSTFWLAAGMFSIYFDFRLTDFFLETCLYVRTCLHLSIFLFLLLKFFNFSYLLMLFQESV